MCNKIKILLIFSLFCILSMYAGKGVYNILAKESASSGFINLYNDEQSVQAANVAGTAIATYDEFSDFNDYIVNLIRTSSYQLPSSVNFLTERTPFQYLRIRKFADNSSCSLYKGNSSVLKQHIPYRSEFYTNNWYINAVEYFIYTLGKLRI